MSMSEGNRVRPEQILVAVPALNEASHIERCLQSLMADTPFMEQVRIVVADGGSTDATQKIVRRLAQDNPNLCLVDNPERYQSAGINAVVALEAAPDHRFLVRCDGHSVYPPAYVRHVVETFDRKSEAASVATVMDAIGASCFQRASAWIVDTPLGSGGSGHRGGTRSGWVDHGHHAGFRLDWFKRVGGYDPTFTHNEDAEYDYRLGQAGGRVWLETDIRLKYHMRPTARQLFWQYWNYGRGRARTVLKHRMRPRLRQMVPVVNFLMLVACLLGSMVWLPLLLLPCLYALLLAGVSVSGMIVMKSFCGLLAGPVLGIIHNAWAAGFVREFLFRAGRRQTT